MIPKILLIDDNAPYARAVERALRNVAHVTVATTVEEARSRITRGSWNAIFLDQHLPDGKGIDLLPLIREHHPRARLQVITGDPTVLSAVSRAGGVMALKSGGLAPLIALVDQCRADMAVFDSASTGTRRRSFSALAKDYGADHGLTAREIEIVELALTGVPNAEIAPTLGISEKTLEGHVSSINRKTKKTRLLEVVAEVLRRAG